MPLATALMVLCLLGSPIPSTGSLGVVVHGYHCSALHWEEVVWGDQASQRLGRLPHAALLAWKGRDELVAFICGTGASRDTSGRLEADALVDQLFARLPQLREFDCFEHVDLEHLERLSSLGVERVWVSHKMPLLVFLFPAVLPLVLLGDPTTLLMQWVG